MVTVLKLQRAQNIPFIVFRLTLSDVKKFAPSSEIIFTTVPKDDKCITLNYL